MKERNEIFNTKVINLFLRKILTKKTWKFLPVLIRKEYGSMNLSHLKNNINRGLLIIYQGLGWICLEQIWILVGFGKLVKCLTSENRI